MQKAGGGGQFEFVFEIVRMCECGWCVSTCERWPELGLNASHHHHFTSPNKRNNLHACC